jgi:2-hydroxy-3-oxopropionate reductase
MGKPESVTYIGPSGSGQVTKLCNQICIGANLAGVAEAYALAKSNGLDRSRVRQALLGGFAGSKVLEFHGNRMLTGDYKPGFFVRLFQKDLRLASEANMATGVTMPVTSVVTQFVNAYVAAGGGELDCAAAAEVWFALSEGKPVKVK